jgi:hypothetical protein
MKSHWLVLAYSFSKDIKMTIFVVKYTKEERFFCFSLFFYISKNAKLIICVFSFFAIKANFFSSLGKTL